MIEARHSQELGDLEKYVIGFVAESSFVRLKKQVSRYRDDNYLIVSLQIYI